MGRANEIVDSETEAGRKEEALWASDWTTNGRGTEKDEMRTGTHAPRSPALVAGMWEPLTSPRSESAVG